MKQPRNDSASSDDAQVVPSVQFRIHPEIQRGFDDVDRLTFPDSVTYLRTIIENGGVFSSFARDENRKFIAPYLAGFLYRIAIRLRSSNLITDDERERCEIAIAAFQGRINVRQMATDASVWRPETPRLRDKGYVYLLWSEMGVYKIGRTKTPDTRLKAFSSLPFEVRCECLIETDNASELEHSLHTRFADKRGRGEWFALNADDVQYIQSLAKVDTQ